MIKLATTLQLLGDKLSEFGPIDSSDSELEMISKSSHHYQSILQKSVQSSLHSMFEIEVGSTGLVTVRFPSQHAVAIGHGQPRTVLLSDILTLALQLECDFKGPYQQFMDSILTRIVPNLQDRHELFLSTGEWKCMPQSPDKHLSESVDFLDTLVSLFSFLGNFTKMVKFPLPLIRCVLLEMHQLTALCSLLSVSDWKCLASSITTNYLQPKLPKDIDQLVVFQSKMLGKCKTFQLSMLPFSEEGVAGDMILVDYLNNAISVAGNVISESFLMRAHQIVSENNYTEVFVGENSTSSGERFGKEESLDSMPPYSFPKCSIHTRVLDLCQIVNDIIEDISRTTSTVLRDLLVKTIRSVLDLYRAFLLVIQLKKEKCTPHLLMMHHNDCHYIAHNCQIWLLKEFEVGLVTHTIVDLTLQFRRLAANLFIEAVLIQGEAINEILGDIDGLGCEAQEEFTKLEKVLQKALYQMNHVAKIWRVLCFCLNYYYLFGSHLLFSPFFLQISTSLPLDN